MFHDGQRRASVTCSVAACLAVLAGTGDLDAQVTFDVVADLGSIGGAAPLGGVIRGADGALYGVTSEGGGADNCGVVYRLDATGVLTPIHEFSRPDGCQPMGELALGPDGSLYGVTRKGGDADPCTRGRYGVPDRARRDVHGAPPVCHGVHRPDTLPGAVRTLCRPDTRTGRQFLRHDCARATSSGSRPRARLRWSTSSTRARRPQRTWSRRSS